MSGIRVLVVDDQAEFRAALRVILDAQPGIEVVGDAADGLAAVRQVDALAPDVVVMDVRMPELDGVEATRRILAAPRERPVRVLVLTTFALDDRAATAIRHGAGGFLLKDATPAQLADGVRAVHAGHSVLAPDDLATLMAGTFRDRPAPPAGWDALSVREREVLELIARGLSNAEIAARIFAAESTVKTHVGSILRKLELRDRTQIAVVAHEQGVGRP